MARCPFHDDRNPSLSFDDERGLWYCHACNIGGDERKLQFLLQREKGVVVNHVCRGHPISPFPSQTRRDPLPSLTYLQDACARLIATLPQHKLFNAKRQLKRATIYRFLIGTENGTYTIPVFKGGLLVNVRFHAAQWDDSGRITWRKWSLRGRPSRLLYPDASGCAALYAGISPKTVIITEGEGDVWTLSQLMPYVDVHTSLAGGKTIPAVVEANIEHFSNRNVVLCLDNDEVGAWAKDELVKLLRNRATLWRICLPEQFKDISEFVHGGATVEVLKKLTRRI